MRFDMNKWSYKTAKLVDNSSVLQRMLWMILGIVFVGVIRWW
jgi:hypothetical protein